MQYFSPIVFYATAITIKPKYLKTGLKFVKACQTTHGGFSRTPHGGIATLEHTYYAVHSIRLISRFNDSSVSGYWL